MAATIDAPQQWVENIAMLRLPEQADRRLQQLMDRNNEGLLTEQERADLAALTVQSKSVLILANRQCAGLVFPLLDDLQSAALVSPQFELYFGTWRHMFLMRAMHWMNHRGQLADCRRAAGRPPLMI